MDKVELILHLGRALGGIRDLLLLLGRVRVYPLLVARFLDLMGNIIRLVKGRGGSNHRGIGVLMRIMSVGMSSSVLCCRERI